MIPIRGLYETHLTVRDLKKSLAFYCDIVGLEFAYEVPARQVAFLWIGGRGKGMLGLWSIGSSPMGLKLHLAFEVSVADIFTAPAKLLSAGVTPCGFNGEPVTEPVVIGWMPAISLYFRDPDEHSIEYLAMLPDKPKPEIGVVPFSQWLSMDQP